MRYLRANPAAKYMSVFILFGVLLALAGCNSSLTTPLPGLSPATTATLPSTATSTPSPSTSSTATVTIDLVAKSVSFDTRPITVPAGASVTINFNNKDSMPHNFALYTDSTAATLIFRGQTVNGPGTATYKFTAPTKPGTYFFRCDIHPTIMTGSFVVQ